MMMTKMNYKERVRHMLEERTVLSERNANSNVLIMDGL